MHSLREGVLRLPKAVAYIHHRETSGIRFCRVCNIAATVADVGYELIKLIFCRLHLAAGESAATNPFLSNPAEQRPKQQVVNPIAEEEVSSNVGADGPTADAHKMKAPVTSSGIDTAEVDFSSNRLAFELQTRNEV
jgi:hypothetical protein